MHSNNLEAIVPLFGIIFTFGIPGLIIFWYLYIRHRERMRLIEKGLTPDEVKKYFSDKVTKPKNPYSTLKFGILFTFVGLGFAVSNILEEAYDMGEGVTFGIILFMGGMGLLIYYMLIKNKINGNNNMSRPVETSTIKNI
jgi:hypothetical protein